MVLAGMKVSKYMEHQQRFTGMHNLVYLLDLSQGSDSGHGKSGRGSGIGSYGAYRFSFKPKAVSASNIIKKNFRHPKTNPNSVRTLH